MKNAEHNLAWADAFVAGLTAAGLRHFVLAPGARSAALALAALRRPELVCHVISDERAAGYFALGIARATQRPAAVLCTSGTAAANLLPAIMEANLAAVPLLVLTADRPAEIHGWGANQTADQTKLYGDQVRAFHAVPAPDAAVGVAYLRALTARLLEACSAPIPGPVHANLPFREPLLPEIIPAPPALPASLVIGAAVPATPDVTMLDQLAAQLSGQPGVIVCGAAAYPPAYAAALANLAARLAAPILAEPLANLRYGPHDKSHLLAYQARFLRASDLAAPAWVLRCGAFPVSRSLERWLASLTDAHHVLLAPPGRWPDPLWRSDTLLRGDPLALLEHLATRVSAAPAAWCARWQQAEANAEQDADAICGASPLFEGSVVRALFAALPAHAHCFVGNSLAIRAVDAFSGTSVKPLTLHGNRGAAGIDGNIATAAGIGTALNAPTVPMALLIGDQSTLHDCGSLALLAGRNIVAVVMDNGGGGIFDQLPFAQVLPAEILTRGWTAPPQVNFAALAAAFGLTYVEADNASALRSALETACATSGPWLIRAVIERGVSRARFAA